MLSRSKSADVTRLPPVIFSFRYSRITLLRSLPVRIPPRLPFTTKLPISFSSMVLPDVATNTLVSGGASGMLVATSASLVSNPFCFPSSFLFSSVVGVGVVVVSSLTASDWAGVIISGALTTILSVLSMEVGSACLIDSIIASASDSIAPICSSVASCSCFNL